MVKINKDEVKHIVELYSKYNQSPRKIEKIYKISRPTIIKILKNNGVNIRSGKQRSFFNENYFENIDTETKAYLVGFLLADGCIHKPSDSQLQLSIQLQKRDLNIIEILKNETGSSKKIVFLKNRNMYKFSLTSDKLCNDLIRLNVVPNKTFTAKFPPMDYIPRDLFRHFLRGLFDGDGCIYKNSTQNFRFDICGTFNICNSVYYYFKGVDINIPKNIYSQGKIFRIFVFKKQLLKQIYKHFYDDANIFLDRKRQIFQQVLLA